jgi:hypothetical protein
LKFLQGEGLGRAGFPIEILSIRNPTRRPEMSKPEIHQENLRWLLTQPADVKIAMLESHLDLCRLLVNEILEEEVTALCGAKYSHEKPHQGRYSRPIFPAAH